METSPEPKDSNNNWLGFLKKFIGDDGLVFLNLDNAITAVKQAQPVWQAPFIIGLYALRLMYQWERVSQNERMIRDVSFYEHLILNLPFQAYQKAYPVADIEGMDRAVSDLDVWAFESAVSDLVGSALKPLEAHYASPSDARMAFHTCFAKAVSDLVGSALEPLEARYASPSDAHTLFYIRFALGVVLLLKRDEELATRILRQMADTKREDLRHREQVHPLYGLDVALTKSLAAIVLQNFYARRQNYEMALYLLTEAVASFGPGHFSESLLAVVPGLLESFAEKCESENDFGEWVDLFDRSAAITRMCGEADTSGDLPSDCKVASPQFLAWKFGQLVARFGIRNGLYPGDSQQLLPGGYQDNQMVADSILRAGGYGDDWQNGTVVASLLCEYDERRNWQILRQQYVSTCEALPRYQWLSLCETGTQTDLYWAMRIGFADQMLSTKEQRPIIQLQTEPSPVVRDIEMTKDIASTIALRQLKQQQDSGKYHESLQNMLEERLPPGKREVRHELQQRLSSVWSKLPAKVVDTLVKAENYYRTDVNTDDAKVWFNKAVEASLSCCLVEPLVSFMQKRGDKRIAICFPPPLGVERKTSYELRKLSLLDWSDFCDTLGVPADKSLASLGAQDLKQFMKEHFGELPPPALRELSRSLRDFCLRKGQCALSHSQA